MFLHYNIAQNMCFASILHTKGVKKLDLRPYQQAAVDAVYNHLRSKDNNPCIVLPTGCHAKDHPILMYDGTMRKAQDVKVGELIMGADSTPRKDLHLARFHLFTP